MSTPLCSGNGSCDSTSGDVICNVLIERVERRYRSLVYEMCRRDTEGTKSRCDPVKTRPKDSDSFSGRTAASTWGQRKDNI